MSFDFSNNIYNGFSDVIARYTFILGMKIITTFHFKVGCKVKKRRRKSSIGFDRIILVLIESYWFYPFHVILFLIERK